MVSGEKILSRMHIWGDMMSCNAARRALASAEQGRDNAQLREVIDGERTRYDVEHSYHGVYDWADLRKATKDVRC